MGIGFRVGFRVVFRVLRQNGAVTFRFYPRQFSAKVAASGWFLVSFWPVAAAGSLLHAAAATRPSAMEDSCLALSLV